MQIRGIFVPNVVPLDAGGRLAESALARFVDWLIDAGAHGLFPNGSTGEFVRFTTAERRRIVQIVCERARGRTPVLAGAADEHVRSTIESCELYAAYGARAAVIVPPFYYRASAEGVYAYVSEIARNAPLDILLYNIPSLASPIDLPTFRRLAEIPRVVGIKDSSGDLGLMLRMIAAVKQDRPDFAFLSGSEALLAPALLMGAAGGTHATANAAPELFRSLFEAAVAGRVDEAQRLQLKMLPLLDAMLELDFPEGFRAGAEARGFAIGPGRAPMTPTQAQARAELKRRLTLLLADL